MTTQEYEFQHFGFPREQISLERRHVLKEVLDDMLDRVLQKLTTTKCTAALLSQRKSKVIEKMFESFEDKLQEIEKYDVENFSIPEHVLLPNDFDQMKEYTTEDEKILDKDITELKQLFLENSIMIAALEMENNQYKVVDSTVNEELAVHSQIQESLKIVDLRKATEMVELACKLSNRNINS